MKFGRTSEPGRVDFTLPLDHPDTAAALGRNSPSSKPDIYVGCAKWNRQDLQNFYPRGVRDELSYYSSQFNCIELNASFYRFFPSTVFAGWKKKTPDGFKFFPKITQVISHRKRLKNTDKDVHLFLSDASFLDEKLGMVFLQMIENFKPLRMQDLVTFIQNWPADYPLAVELRHTEWFNDLAVTSELYQLFEKHNITNIITDTAARRDLLHMRLTTPYAFVRYVGANHSSDYTRLDDWVERLKLWIDQGIRGVYFFVHQNHELESPLLARHFIERINSRLGYDLKVPAILEPQQPDLF